MFSGETPGGWIDFSIDATIATESGQSSDDVIKTEKFYDIALRLLLIACFLCLLALELQRMRGIVAVHPYFGGDLPYLIGLASKSAIVVFLCACIVLHASPYRHLNKHLNPYAKVVSLVGTLLSVLLLLTTRTPSVAYWDALSMALILVGTSVFALAIFELRRSTLSASESEQFATTGLHGRIRHPLHLAEAIVAWGIFAQFRSLQGLIFLAVHVYFLLRRMDVEDGVLEKLYPAFAGYKERTKRLVPGVY